MVHGSFFPGLGAFDLAAEWMGWRTILQCEIDQFCQRVLKYYWPDAELFKDIRGTDFTQYRGLIDVLSGGLPCQPYSVAGERRGKDDVRHLWPEYYRVIREIRPRWVVGENVRGFISWNGGMVFEEVQSDLEALGYEVLPFLLPACGVNAPHERYRVFFIAYTRRQPCDRRQGAENGSFDNRENARWEETPNIIGGLSEKGASADTNTFSREGWRDTNQSEAPKGYTCPRYSWGGRDTWEDFPTQSPLFARNDGLSSQLDGITLHKWRVESIRGAGNAVVPPLALQIFKAIQLYENQIIA